MANDFGGLAALILEALPLCRTDLIHGNNEKPCIFRKIRINWKARVKCYGLRGRRLHIHGKESLRSAEARPPVEAPPEAGRKWRRNPLKSLKTGPEMASCINTPKAPRKASPCQFNGATQKAAWIRALSDMDLEPPRLQNAIEVLADE
jgi:hypothetical protein